MNKEEELPEEAALEENHQNEEKDEGPLSQNITLFKHDSYTDGEFVYLDVMTPVNISPGSGKVSIDKSKPKRFIGKTQVDFGGRVAPYSFMIEGANNVKEAVDMFDSSLNKAIEHTREEIEEMRKEQMSQKPNIVVPESAQEGGGKIIV